LCTCRLEKAEEKAKEKAKAEVLSIFVVLGLAQQSLKFSDWRW